MGAWRRRGWDPRGPCQYDGGAVDGLAELPATVSGSEQGVSLSVRGDVRVGPQRQAGDRGVHVGTVERAVRHHQPYMSHSTIHAIAVSIFACPSDPMAGQP